MPTKLLLIQPPITDPTCGCAALPALSAYVKKNYSSSVACLDANVDAIEYLMQPCRVAESLEKTADELREFREGIAKGLSTELRQKRFVDLQLARTLHEKDPILAAGIFKDAVEFFDYRSYYWAAKTFQKWLGILARPEVPGIYMNFGNNEYLGKAIFDRFGIKGLLQSQITKSFVGPFEEYFAEKLIPRLHAFSCEFVGLTVNSWVQLPFAIEICRLIKDRLPTTCTLFGGPVITQLFKYAREADSIKAILNVVDLLVVADGEKAIVDILDSIHNGKPTSQIHNVVDRTSAKLPLRFEYVDLREIPVPSVEDLPLASYLSPEPFVLYAPTRGCYWNRCTFCDYGLSQGSPTAPYRERPLDLIIQDIEYISKFSRFIYFSVDSISPSLLNGIATKIIKKGLDIRWGAEIRLDMPNKRKFFKTLRDSGCVGVSVGFESANSRILKKINKGTQIGQIENQLRKLAEVGIGVQLMGFTGFPTETFDEACESISFLEKNRNNYVFGSLDSFILTSDSKIAQRPEQFGICNLHFRKKDDLHAFPKYDEIVPSKTSAQEKEILQLKKNLNKIKLKLKRPFVGGIDTAHTLMYLNRYGLTIKHQLRKAILKNLAETNQIVDLNGVVVDYWPVVAGYDPEPRTREEHHIIAEDGSVFSCDDDVAEAAALLAKHKTLKSVLNEISTRPLSQQLHLIYSLNRLREQEFIIKEPTHLM